MAARDWLHVIPIFFVLYSVGEMGGRGNKLWGLRPLYAHAAIWFAASRFVANKVVIFIFGYSVERGEIAPAPPLFSLARCYAVCWNVIVRDSQFLAVLNYFVYIRWATLL